MSDRRSSRGSSNGSKRPSSSSSGGARRAAGVRRSTGSSDRAGAKNSKRPAPKGTSRTGRNRETASSSRTKAAGAGAGSSGAGARRTSTSGSRTSVGARHAGAGPTRTTKKAAATNFLNYPRAGAKNPWRWIPSLRLIVGAMALMVLAGLGLGVWVYVDTDVPEPTDYALAETTRVYFADGETEMGKFSEINRTILPGEEIPQNVKDAAVASEDASFYENRGVSPRGIVRALINNLRGGDRQGASTITQQYVERYHTGNVTSYVGKAREAVMALKTDQELSKDEILNRYLNTIYFGRGAYGVQEASQAYFDKDASELTDEEAALLVAVIPAPSAYDPAANPDRAAQLWTRVVERQVNDTGTLTAQEADEMEFPETIEPHSDNVQGGTDGYLLATVRSELEAQGFTADEINTGGFTVISTIDPSIQENTVAAVEELPEDRPERNRVGTVTMEPRTGAIRGMYGGPDYVEQGQNDSTQSRMQAGSTFKTFTLIAALEDGYPLSSSWDGNSPKSFPGGWQVNNFNNIDYGRVTLKRATTSSINTAYAEANIAIGPERTQETAIALGLPEDTPGLDGEASNVLGSASPTVLEMAEVYSTIASGGIHRPGYMVESVEQPDGSMAYQHEAEESRVLEEDVAINATVALQGPPSAQGSARKLQQVMGGRPIAGKTGTSESFRSAWFVGFTPQLVTSVGMFQPSEDGTSEERLTPFGGEDPITGSTYPTAIWGSIMSSSLEGQEMLEFPQEVQLNNQRPAAPSPTQTPQPGPEPTEEPAEEPSEEETTEEEPEPTEEETTEEEPEPTEEETTEEEPEPTEEETTEEEPEPTEEEPAEEEEPEPTEDEPAEEEEPEPTEDEPAEEDTGSDPPEGDPEAEGDGSDTADDPEGNGNSGQNNEAGRSEAVRGGREGVGNA